MGNDNDAVRRDNFLGNDNQSVGDEIMTSVFVKEELLARQLVHSLDTLANAHSAHIACITLLHTAHCTVCIAHLTAK